MREESISFLQVVYTPLAHSAHPIVVEAQVVPLGGDDFLWIDGVDFADPILVPVDSFPAAVLIGTLDDLMESFADEIGLLAMSEDLTEVSPTLLMRAARYLREEQCSPGDALQWAYTFGQLLVELDELDRRFLQTAVDKTLAAVSIYESPMLAR